MTVAKNRACLGAFAGAHGVKGAVKVKSFTETPDNIAAYGPVTSEDGARRFTLKFIRVLKQDFVLVSAPEIGSREDAESLKGVRVYVDRDKLPSPETDEFYLDDLVGLDAIDEAGEPIGRVSAVHNFGAGDLVELTDIPDVNGVRVIAFTKQNIPVVDIEGGKITVQRQAIALGEDGDDNSLANDADGDAATCEEDS